MIEITSVMAANLIVLALASLIGWSAYGMRDWDVTLIGLPIIGALILIPATLYINGLLVII